MRQVLFLSILALFVSATSGAQWTLLSRVPGYVNCIYSIDNDSVILEGGGRNSFWSIDEGHNWQQINVPLPNITSFAFKDRLTGWLSGVSATSSIFATADGGLHWSALNLPGDPNSIHFERSKGELWILNWELYQSMTSFDDGITWTPFSSSYRNGITFIDPMHAVIAKLNGSDSVMVTSDGGSTWLPVYMPAECWQPATVPGSRTVIMFSETGGSTRSVDDGLSWTKLASESAFLRTGDIEPCDCGMSIIAQAISASVQQGLFFSTNEGDTWTPIGGPSNEQDTRIFYSGRFLYAAANNNGHTGEIWRYEVHHKPAISYPSHMSACIPIDTTFHVSFTNTCFGIPASLDRISLTGSNSFVLDPIVLPLALSNEQDFAIHYRPQLGAHDTALLYLKFNQHGDIKDTTLTIIGNGFAPMQNISFSPVASVSHAPANDRITIGIYPMQPTASVGLDTMQFTLAFNGNVLDYESVAGVGVSAIVPPVTGEHSVIPISIVNPNMSLDPSKPIAELTFRVMLSDSLHTRIALHDLIANPDDKSYSACVLELEADSSSFDVDLQCGDSVLVSVLRGEQPAFRIESIAPNPSRDGFNLVLDDRLHSGVRYELLDELGDRRSEGTAQSGESRIETAGLPSGVYYLRLSESGYVTTGRVVVR